MKVQFIGFEGNRQHHQDWAFQILTETEFEKTFLEALFQSGGLEQMQPKAALIFPKTDGLAIMVEAEDFRESQLAKERIEHLKEVEELNKKIEALKASERGK